MSYIRPIGVAISAINTFYKYKKYLSNDVASNYEVCQKLSTDIINSAKVDYKIEGIENVLEDEPVLVTSNHICFFDIAALAAAIDKPMPFAAAKELINNKIINDYIASINSVLIDRETEDLKIMKKQLEDMEKAISTTGLILFPEGECSYGEGDIKEFKKGGFIAAKKNDISIVPTYINYEALERIGRLVVPKGEVKVIFDKPFKASQLEKKTNARELASIARKKVLELRNNI